MLRAQLPYSRNVAKRNSWAGYHINILASDDQTATESFSMRESKSTFKKTLEGRGIYPSFSTLVVRGLSLSCFCTYSDALYQLFEASVRGWQVSRASTFCLTGNLRRPRSDEATVKTNHRSPRGRQAEAEQVIFRTRLRLSLPHPILY